MAPQPLRGALAGTVTNPAPPPPAGGPVGAEKVFAGRKAQTRAGMSAQDWATRWNEVDGAGRVTLRRIYADLGAGANDNRTLIEATIADGLTPLISYKGLPTATNEARAQTTAATLQSYGVPVAVTWFHEPTDNLTAAVWQQGNNLFGPIFAAKSNISFGPIFNGFHLDRAVSVFDEYNTDELFDAGYWDWFGIDTYQAGTNTAPQPTGPAERVTLLKAWLQSRGYGHWQALVGEYNTWTATELRQFHDAVFATTNDLGDPFFWAVTMWNTTTGKGLVLSGDRLTEYRRFLSDNRLWKPENPGESIP